VLTNTSGNDKLLAEASRYKTAKASRI